MHKIKKLYSQASGSELIRHNMVFFLGTMGIAVLNYAYYPIIGRLVSVPDFGEIQAVISLFMQLGIVLTAFGYVITNIVSNNVKQKDNSVILGLEQLMVAASIISLLGVFGLSVLLKDSLKLTSIFPVLLVGLLIVVNIPSTSRTYILQGMKKLKEVSTAGIIYAAGKLVLTVVFIFLVTNDITAAMCGYVFAQLLMLWYVERRVKGRYVSLRKSLRPVHYWHFSTKQRKLIKNEIVYGVVIAVILSGLALLYTSDTIIARLFFEPYELGVYSAASSVARIVYFVTASVAGVLIASVKLDETPANNYATLRKSLIILGVLGGACVAAFALAPRFFITLLVGEAYIEGAALLPLLSGVMLLCSVNNLLAIYQIALRRYSALIPIFTGAVVMVGGMALYHATFLQFILVMLTANAVMTVILFIEIAVEKKRGYIHGEGSIVGRPAEL